MKSLALRSLGEPQPREFLATVNVKTIDSSAAGVACAKAASFKTRATSSRLSMRKMRKMRIAKDHNTIVIKKD